MFGLSPVAFQRSGATVSTTLATTTAAGSVSLQVAGYAMCEIVNTSATISAAFAFTPSGPTTAAAATDRIIPPLSVLYELLPAGCQSASAIPLASGTPTIYFTPGNTVR